MKLKHPTHKFLCLLAVIFLSSGCSKGAEDKDVIAYVNKEPVLSSELEGTMSLMARQDPTYKESQEANAAQLDLIIDKKLMIQNAVKEGLSRDDNFVKAIKAYWEQTLIREFLDKKRQEFDKKITVSEKDIKQFYDNLGSRVTIRFFKNRDRHAVSDVYNSLAAGQAPEDIQWETAGPLRYGDIVNPALLKAFSMDEGQARIIEASPYYYVVVMDKREASERKPLEELRGQIEERVRSLKEREMFNEWLTKARENAKIKIINHTSSK